MLDGIAVRRRIVGQARRYSRRSKMPLTPNLASVAWHCRATEFLGFFKRFDAERLDVHLVMSNYATQGRAV